MLDGFYRSLGITGVTLALNSMGDAQSRPGYVAALREYFLDHAGELGPEFVERVEANPMRVLDSKAPDWQDVVERAPQLTEHLSDAALDHFEQVQEGLQALGIKYGSRPGSSAGSTTTRARRSSSRAMRWTPLRTRSAAVDATTVSPRRWVGHRPRGSDSAPASSDW